MTQIQSPLQPLVERFEKLRDRYINGERSSHLHQEVSSLVSDLEKQVARSDEAGKYLLRKARTLYTITAYTPLRRVV